MEIKLRKMTSQEYNSFYSYSSEHHANELMQELNISFDEALHETKKELKEMLPKGLKTKNQSLMVIEDKSDNRFVGFMWYFFESEDGIQQVFLCDFVIQEQERRKGYATAAMYEMEKNAASCGCKQSILFVAKENIPARELYAKCGYDFQKNSGYGMFLKKKL